MIYDGTIKSTYPSFVFRFSKIKIISGFHAIFMGQAQRTVKLTSSIVPWRWKAVPSECPLHSERSGISLDTIERWERKKRWILNIYGILNLCKRGNRNPKFTEYIFQDHTWAVMSPEEEKKKVMSLENSLEETRQLRTWVKYFLTLESKTGDSWHRLWRGQPVRQAPFPCHAKLRINKVLHSYSTVFHRIRLKFDLSTLT